jgi:hypothetical protein
MTRTMRPTAAVATGAVLAMVSFGGSARADKASDADRLFREGQTLLEKGSLDDACARFQESNDLDSTLGTVLALAYCDEQHGKKSAAYQKYVMVERAAEAKGDASRKNFAHEHAKKLEGDVPRLVLTNLPRNALVTVDGQNVAYVPAGVPIGSGEHAIIVTAPGKSPTPALELTVGDSETGKKQVSVPDLRDDPNYQPDRPGRRMAGFIIGGVGIAGVAVGSVFGLKTFSDRSSADSAVDCKDKTQCGPIGYASISDAKTAATISTIGFGVGVVGLGVGAWLILTSNGTSEAPAPATAHVTPLVGPGSLGLRGTF